MTFIPHTPESLIPRSDSKNPATTCKGITSSGRPCRRALATNPGASPQPSTTRGNGVVALISKPNNGKTEAAAVFCWQHKDQAQILAAENKSTKIVELESRTSIDTLVDRLGGLNTKPTPLKKTIAERRRAKRSANAAVDPGPTYTTSGNDRTPSSSQSCRPSQKSPGKSELLLSLFCCFRPPSEKISVMPQVKGRQQCVGEDRDDWDTSSTLVPPREARTRVLRDGRLVDVCELNGYAKPTSMKMEARNTATSSSGNPFSQRSARPQRLSTESPNSSRRPLSQQISDRHRLPHEPPSQTAAFLSLIPLNLNPNITSSLLAELGKPVSAADDPGFIYIFWLTPTTTTMNSTQTPISLSGATNSVNNARNDGSSATLSSLPARVDERDGSNKTILLKIGRASNVQRRMNEWVRQCDYDLSLIRFYPYVSNSSSSSTPSSSRRSESSTSAAEVEGARVRKVPHAHKVERLIHIELAELRVKRSCETCGREHREWFEIEASREGVKAVDEVVRRWVAWAETCG